MKFKDLKVGMQVMDRWYPDWGVGIVTKVLKTVVYIDFTIRGLEKYDKSHVFFIGVKC
jgi:hypothetical protein